MAKPIKWLAFGCPHFILHDPEAIEWLLGRIGEHRPDVIVCLGDLFEANSASRWPNEYDWTLIDEYRQGDLFLADVRKAAPNAKRIFLPGNHDDNILAIGRINKDLRKMCDWRSKQHDTEDQWINKEIKTQWQHPADYVYCRNRGVYRIGQVTFAHGYECNQCGDEFHSILLGVPYGLYVGAHTHRPEQVTQALRTKTVPLPYWHCNTGCLRDLKPNYVRRRRTHGWGQACVVGEAEPLKSPRMSRCWDAHVEVFKMYDQWANK